MESNGEAFEFEWYIYPGHTTMDLLHGLQTRMATRGIRPEEFEDRIIFMSMCSDIAWSKGKEIFNECYANSIKVRDCAKRFLEGYWSFLGPGDEEKWYGTHV